MEDPFNVDNGDLQILFPLRSIFIGMPLIMLLYVLTAVSYIAVLPVAQYDWAGSGQNAAVILFLAPQKLKKVLFFRGVGRNTPIFWFFNPLPSSAGKIS